MNPTGTPKVIINTTSGNLLRQVPVLDTVAGIIGTAKTPELIGKINTIYSYDDALTKGYTEENEPFLHHQIKHFYNELGGHQELWVQGVEDTMTMAQMLTSTNSNGLKKLLTLSQGRVNLVFACRQPDDSYNSGSEFLDTDVKQAVTQSKALCEYQQSINRPVRLLIEGRINDVSVNPFYKPIEGENTYVGVVIGGDKNDGSALGTLALARACKYGAHIKLGNGQNGVLSLTQAYIGNKKLEEFSPTELDNLTDAGYILMHRREGSAGYYFSVDKMAGKDDFHILAHGRIIDKAQRIAAATTTPFLETSVRIDTNGNILESDAKYIEELIKAQIIAQMSEQISGVEVIVPIEQDLINTSKLQVQIKIQPLGYLTWIVVTLGLTKTI